MRAIQEEWRMYVYPETGKKYQVSSFGNVKSTNAEGKEYEHTTYKNNRYRCIPTTKANGKNTLIYLHKIVADLFVENPNNFRRLVFADGNPENCKATNLKYISDEEFRELNRSRTKPYDIYENYTPNAKLTPSKVAIIKKRALDNERDQKTRWTIMAKQFGIDTKHLWMIRKGIIWGHVKPAK